VRLDASFVEGLSEGADGLVGVLPVEEVDLFEGPPGGFRVVFFLKNKKKKEI